MKDTVKVAHLVISLNNGGLENLVCLWANERNNRQNDSTYVVCLDELGLLSTKISQKNLICVDANRAKFPWDHNAVSTIREFCNSTEIDVIHSHNLVANQYAGLATKGTKINHIQTIHGFNLHGQNIRNKVRGRLLTRYTDQYVSVGQDVEKWASKFYAIHSSQIQTIRNGVRPHIRNSNTEIQLLKESLSISQNSLVLGFVGRLETVKGLDRLLPIFKELLNSLSLNFLIVGDGSQQSSLQSQCSTLGISNEVHFLGFQENCSLYYDAMDLLIMPSRSEGLSVAFLEAMAASCPIAATDVGEHGKIIESANCGIILPEFTTDWELIIKTLLEESDYHSLGRNGMAYVNEHFSNNKTMAEYEQLYTQICSKR